MTHATECTLIESQLYLFAGGELAADESQLVEQHAQRCASCAALLERIQASRAALAGAACRADEPLPELWPALQARLFAQPAAAPASAPVRAAPVPARGARWVWLAAGGLAAAAALVLWARLSAPEPSAVPEAGLVAEHELAPAPEGLIVPVDAPAGLRRVGSDEPSLSDMALDPRLAPRDLARLPEGSVPVAERQLR